MRRRISTRLAALAAAGFAVGGVAAAAAGGVLSGGTDDAAHARVSASVDDPNEGNGVTATPDSNGTQGPDVNGPAKFGLCNAYVSGEGVENGGKEDSTAFRALATAAAGSPGDTDAARIAAFCADVLSAEGHGEESPPSHEAGSASKGESHHGKHGGGNATSQDASDGHSGGEGQSQAP